MNWDWDKLQEKRRHQPSGLDGKGKKTQEDQNSRDHENNPYTENQKKDDDNFFGFGGGGNNNNNNPFNGRKNPREMMNNLNLPGTKWIVTVLALLWLASGIFIVDPGEAGVILRFGAYNRTVEPGIHYRLPFPIESVTLPQVALKREIIIGQSFSSSQQSRGGMQNDEASMLTGDENIISIKFIIQYNIKPTEVVNYLYKVAQPDQVVKKAAEAAMREVIGKNLLDDALTTRRNQIQQDVEVLLQNILDSYHSGIQILTVQMQDVQPPVEVRDAFKDVASAREDKERLMNEAQAYRSDILPKAQGTAAAKVNQAEAYKETRILNAEGEASRFLAILAEYNKAKDVTKKRLLLETMEQLLAQPNIDKVVLPAGMSGQVLPFLPLGASNMGISSQAPATQPTQQNEIMPQTTTNNLQSRSAVRGGR